MPVAFLKTDRSNPNFLLEKYACLLAKDTECVSIISELYSNKLMLPVGALASYFLQPDVNLFL